MAAVKFWALVAAFRRDRVNLAATAFVQVIFVAANTVFISAHQLLPNFITGFLISLVWTFNVKRVAFGDLTDRWFYATGAAFGSVSGTVVAGWIV